MAIEDGRALGIDVSHHRGTVNWNLVRAAGIRFAFIKATEHTSFVDSQFDINWRDSRNAGMMRGAYHFFRPAYDAEAQAEHYLARVGDIYHRTDLPPVLDVEAYPSNVYEEFLALTLTQRINRVRKWLTTVAEATGKTPIIYTNQSTWIYVMGNTNELTNFPLWVAHYGVTTPSIPGGSWGGNSWTFWQYTGSGTVPGVNDGDPPVDRNVFNGSATELVSWAGFKVRPDVPLLTNQQMHVAVTAAGENLGLTNWVSTLGLSYLTSPTSNASRPYNGLAPSEFSITTHQEEVLWEFISEQITGQHPDLQGKTNQDVINIFYNAAERLNTAGWTLITKAGLTEIINDRAALYTGPYFDEIDTLSSLEQQTLIEVLNEMNGETGTYGGLTGQGMIDAVYWVADQIGIARWTYLVQLGLQALINHRDEIYEGPEIEDLPNTNYRTQKLLADYLGVDLLVYSGPETPVVPYPGLLNQDMINIFYNAAALTNELGWDWIEQAGMEYLTNDRYSEYIGFKVEVMPNLSDAQKNAMLSFLSAYRNVQKNVTMESVGV